MPFGTLSGLVDCLCLLTFGATFLCTANRIDAAARRGRKD
jgi:hypothetical protein